jgi:prepilin-type N-terminal cleavage/methylation domain-containing protein
MHLPRHSKARQFSGFTLIELLVVVAIIGILAALLLPTIGNMVRGSQVTKSASSLKQIATAFQMYAGDNDGVIPAVASMDNKTAPNIGPAGKDAWWTECLAGYLGSTNSNREAADLSQVYIDPCFRALVGKNNSPTWRGGYSMNTRVNLVRGETYSQWNTNSSRYVRYKLASIRGDSVLVTMGAYEGFAPNNDGTQPDERFSPALTTPVPHNKRIGANNKGLGGKTALYMFADGSVKNLTPQDAAEFLKLR